MGGGGEERGGWGNGDKGRRGGGIMDSLVADVI